MRHQKKGRKLKRVKKQRKALLKGLARELILREKIKTTEAKAKELRPFVEKIISRARKDSVASRRLVRKFMDKGTTKKLFEAIGPKYKERKGGYTRIIKIGKREKDQVKQAIIELV